MTFEQLHHFFEVYHTGSITKAALNLQISRQAISNSIKKLENVFNVMLFERSANGVVPTKAGKALYKHAHIIIKEESALQQNMLSIQNNIPLNTVCHIGLAESLLLVYGEELLQSLSETFPETYFDISTFVFESNKTAQYRDFDISIPILFDSQFAQMLDSADEEYMVSTMADLPVYVWLSADSPFNQYETLHLSMLKGMPFCTLKNSYNANNTAQFLALSCPEEHHPPEEIYLKNNFIDHIERFGYYTTDFPIINNRFFYEDLMANHHVVLKPTDALLSKKIIYKKTTCQNFYPVILDILS